MASGSITTEEGSGSATLPPGGKDELTGGTVALVRAPDGLYLHATDWSVTEGPDLYFYVSDVDAVALEDEPKTIGERSAQLTMNNLRPSNLGFEGESLWLRVPASYADASTVLIHCTKYHKIFGIAALEGPPAVAATAPGR